MSPTKNGTTAFGKSYHFVGSELFKLAEAWAIDELHEKNISQIYAKVNILSEIPSKAFFAEFFNLFFQLFFVVVFCKHLVEPKREKHE